jgi:hypothetical protein
MEPLGGVSHYKEHYPPKSADRDVLCPRLKNPPLVSHAPKEHFLTTKELFAEAVKNSSPERARSYKPAQTSVQHGEFYGETTMRKDFPGHSVTPYARPPVPKVIPRASGFWETTNAWMQAPVKQAIHDGTVERTRPMQLRSAAPPHQPFDGTTSYRTQYVPKSPEGHHSKTRSLSATLSRETRDFLTTKTLSYMAPDLPKLPPCPAASVPRRPPSRDGHIKADL